MVRGDLAQLVAKPAVIDMGKGVEGGKYPAPLPHPGQDGLENLPHGPFIPVLWQRGYASHADHGNGFPLIPCLIFRQHHAGGKRALLVEISKGYRRRGRGRFQGFYGLLPAPGTGKGNAANPVAFQQLFFFSQLANGHGRILLFETRTILHEESPFVNSFDILYTEGSAFL